MGRWASFLHRAAELDWWTHHRSWRESQEEEEGEVYLYRYSEGEDGQPNLENIEDDEEYEIVADAFDEMLDELNRYTDENKRKFDIVAAACMALLADEEL